MARTRITGRKWTEKQRAYKNGVIFQEMDWPYKLKEENGLKIKVFKPGYATGVSASKTARGVK